MPETKFADQIHAEKYRGPGESMREWGARVASALKDDDSHFHALKDVLREQRFLPGGRIQAAAGSPRHVTAFNCFVMPTIEDSFADGQDSIMGVATQSARTMRMGGGVGYDFSTLRPRGSLIKTLGSRSSGPVAFMEIFDAVCRATMSAGHRRGAQMAVLRIDHPDVEEFVRAKQTPGCLTGFNVSVAVTDEFMRALLSLSPSFPLAWGGQRYGEVDPSALWEQIMRSTWDWAEPGVLFVDTINRMNNLWYCERIDATNPCFTGDTLVWTAHGPRRFDDLARTGDTVPVLTQLDDGRLAYRDMTRPRLTGRQRSLIKITMRGSQRRNKTITTITCTPNHQVFLTDGSSKPAAELQPGDRLASAYRMSANRKGYVKLRGGQDEVMEHHVGAEYRYGRRPEYPREHVHHINGVKNDNCPENVEIVLASDHNSANMRHKNAAGLIPRGAHNARRGAANGMHGRKHSEETLRKIGSKTSDRFNDPSFRERHASGVRAGMARMTPEARSNNHTVVRVEHVEHVEDVYCGTVAATGRFFVQCGPDEGVLVANCGEQPLPPHGACLLGSVNAVKYVRPSTLARWEDAVDWDLWRRDLQVAYAALDNVIDRTSFPLPEQQREALAKRRIGIGITGLADALEGLGMSYGSDAFVDATGQVLRFQRDVLYRAAAARAKARGPFPLFDRDRYLTGEFVRRLPADIRDEIAEHGIRNSHLTSIAPTGTISLAADNVSSGIEPPYSLTYDRTVRGFDGDEVVRVQDYAARVWGVRPKTADECTVRDHLAVLAEAQRFVDSAVSKTVNVGDDVSWEQFQRVYEDAWQFGCKGITTFRAAGKRMGILQAVNEAEEGAACRIDPETGVRTCDE